MNERMKDEKSKDFQECLDNIKAYVSDHRAKNQIKRMEELLAEFRTGTVSDKEAEDNCQCLNKDHWIDPWKKPGERHCVCQGIIPCYGGKDE